jgi:hypothetical protein
MIKRTRLLNLPMLVTMALAAFLIASDSARATGIATPLPPEDQQMISAQLGSGVVGNPLPSEPIEDASTYFPLQERSSIYQVTGGRHVGRRQALAVRKVQRANGKLAWRFEFSPSLTGFIHQTREGDIVMPSLGDTGQGIVVVTTPANPFLVKGMKPGETRSYDQQVQVFALDDPTDREYSGWLHGQFTYFGNYQVIVPAGAYEAALFRLKCHGKVGPAETHDTAYYFFAPGKGVVAMITQEDATAFWLIHIDSTSGRVLTTTDHY